MLIFVQRRFVLAPAMLVCLLLVTAQLMPKAQAADRGGDRNDAQKVAAGVDAHYNQLRSMQADFSETYRGAGASRTESGTLWLKKPGKMRWEYREPRPKLFVSDGKTAWFYVPGEPQAQRAPVSKIDDLRSPIRFLLGKAKLGKELQGLHVDGSGEQAGNVVLSGVPKGMEDRISRVLLEVTPQDRIVRLSLLEVDGASTEFRFTSQKENLTVADQQFRFSPPEGVGVVEATELGD
ncbi:MAG TPA: outer membrane lipoprotein chaperone LolA [Terriglobales bacterium]|nr:outer membrane lipoprotein chaperone LolA [Terriglobales bacterium]